MESMWRLWVVAVLVIPLKATTVVRREIRDISVVEKEYTPKTMVIFDVDDTLLEYKQGFPLVQGDRTRLQFQLATQLSHSVLILTARYASEAHDTITQLKRRGIQAGQKIPDSFYKHVNAKDHIYPFEMFSDGNMVAFKKGVIYTSHSDKGRALFYYLCHLCPDDLPERIVFVDDMKFNNDAVEKLFSGNFLLPSAVFKDQCLDCLNLIRSKIKEVYLYHYRRVGREALLPAPVGSLFSPRNELLCLLR